MATSNTDPTKISRVALHNAIKETSDPVERGYLAYLLETVDHEAYAELQARHLQLRSRWRNRLDITYYAQKSFRFAKAIGLIEAAPSRVLDIGCGPSHLALLGAYLGHDVVGLDVPDSPLFNDLNELFGTPRILHTITPMERLPDTGRPFNLVCAISANFHHKPGNRLFDEREWRFLLQDIASRSTCDSYIHLVLNKIRQAAGMRHDSDEFKLFVHRLGGTVSGQHVTFQAAQLAVELQHQN